MARRKIEGLTAFEDRVLEFAVKFWTYQDHRMGKRLAVVPIQNSDDQQWVSLADMMHTEWDEKSDPTGLMRQAPQQFLSARTACLPG